MHKCIPHAINGAIFPFQYYAEDSFGDRPLIYVAHVTYFL